MVGRYERGESVMTKFKELKRVSLSWANLSDILLSPYPQKFSEFLLNFIHLSHIRQICSKPRNLLFGNVLTYVGDDLWPAFIESEGRLSQGTNLLQTFGIHLF